MQTVSLHTVAVSHEYGTPAPGRGGEPPGWRAFGLIAGLPAEIEGL